MNTPQDKANYYVSEYLKCKQNFEYFCRNYVYLELPGGDKKFVPYQKQLELINLIKLEKHVIVLKSRQIGISTVVRVYSAYLCIFYENVVIGIISKDGGEATDFGRGIKQIISKIPIWMKPTGGPLTNKGFEKSNEQSFIMSNGSKLFVATVAPIAPEKTLRGKSLCFLVIDEAAFINKLEEVW